MAPEHFRLSSGRSYYLATDWVLKIGFKDTRNQLKNGFKANCTRLFGDFSKFCDTF